MIDLMKRIHELEKLNIIEIIDDNGVSDMTCRFLIPFYRETIYERLLFREHKKGLHSLSAEFIMNNVMQVDVTRVIIIVKSRYRISKNGYSYDNF